MPLTVTNDLDVPYNETDGRSNLLSVPLDITQLLFQEATFEVEVVEAVLLLKKLTSLVDPIRLIHRLCKPCLVKVKVANDDADCDEIG